MGGTGGRKEEDIGGGNKDGKRKKYNTICSCIIENLKLQDTQNKMNFR